MSRCVEEHGGNAKYSSRVAEADLVEGFDLGEELI